MLLTSMIRRFSIVSIALLAVAVFGIPSARTGDARSGAADEPQEPGMLTFSTVGDSRQDPVSPDPSQLPLTVQDAIWLQNTKAFSRILESVRSQHASMLFFNGDMIMGYGKAGVPADASTVDKIVNSDLVQFYRQYAFWRGMVAGLMERGTYVVPVPGNHETQWKAGGKKAQVENENAWRANMADLILDDQRFTTLFGQAPASENVGDNSAADGLTTNQSRLSYSFDFRGSHFAVINTDPVGKDAHAPTAWLALDLAAARARGVKRSFVFGHKPAFTYYYGAGASAPLPATPSGLDGDIAARDAFWDVIEQYGAVYFCGHEHIFNLSQPRKATGGKAWQVLVGSGGSPFEAKPADTTLHPNTDRDYAWVTVKVIGNGMVQLAAYGFDEHFGNTRLLQTVVIH